MIAGRKNKSSG